VPLPRTIGPVTESNGANPSYFWTIIAAGAMGGVVVLMVGGTVLAGAMRWHSATLRLKRTTRDRDHPLEPARWRAISGWSFRVTSRLVARSFLLDESPIAN
jgi:hypothetical protein